MSRVSKKYHGPGLRRQSPLQAYVRHLAKWMLICLALLTITPVVLSALLEKRAPASKCTELLARDRVPAHVRIKCREVAA